jgi:hypothetical protein
VLSIETLLIIPFQSKLIAILSMYYYVITSHFFPDEMTNLVYLCYFSETSAGGYATLETEQPGSLTPMLGDKKVGL